MKRFTALLFAVLIVLSALAGAACAKASASYNAADSYIAYETSAPASWRTEEKAGAGSYSSYYEMPQAAPYDEEVEEEWYEDEPAMPEPTAAPEEDLPGFAESKLIYTCDMTIQTTEFDTTISRVHELIEKYNGFIASETRNDNDTAWYRTGYVKTSASLSETLTVRIPAQNYNAFLNDLDGNGKILSKNMYVENISRQYSETETTIKSLETQEERLLDMLAQCETVEDMITVEARLSEVQNELKIYRNRLSSMDTDVAYSTVNMSIYEVLEYTEDKPPVKVQTFGDRLKNTLKDTGEIFLDFLEGLLFGLIYILPYLLIIGGIVFLIIWLVRRNRKKNGGKPKDPPARPAAPVKPSIPAKPAQPAQPAKPANPAAPEKPAAPDKPIKMAGSPDEMNKG